MSKRMHVTRWVMTLTTVFVLVLLAWQCVWIYWEGSTSGRSPIFSAALVQERLRPVLPILVLYIVLVLGSLILASLETREKSRITIAPEDRLRLMKSRVAELPEGAKALERQRRVIILCAGTAVLICAVPCLVYLLNPSNFTSWDLEQVMGQLLLHVVPWVLVGFGVVVAASYVCGQNVRRETELLKGCLGQETSEETAVRRTHLSALRTGLYAIAILFIVLGVMNGGMRDVLVKAINICTECIGLG